MASDPGLHEQIGRHTAEIQELSRRVGTLEDQNNTIIRILSEQRGGWKTFGVISAIVGFVGYVLSQTKDWLNIHH